MKIIISGSSGLVGSNLIPLLVHQQHSVRALVRSQPSEPHVFWNPPKDGPDPGALEGTDAVIHLAGEGIASGRWTAAKMRAIRDSRVLGTKCLVESLVRMKTPPKTLIAASAIGYYGDRGDERLTEESPAGQGFLAEVCSAWENEARVAAQRGIRVVLLRLGIILSPKGGALAKMLLPFKLGLGGRLGHGQQYMSWVAIDDVSNIILYALQKQDLMGPVNGVAPSSVTNADYTSTLGRVLGRPTVFPMPAFAARLAFGKMADALLLSSGRVEPAALSRSGYTFLYPRLEDALRHLLQR